MGKQTTFYMLDRDEAELRSFVEKQGGMLFPYAADMPNQGGLEELPQIGQKFAFSVSLWSPDCKEPMWKYIPQQKYYVIDSLRSEVVEWSRSYKSEKGLVRGRFFCEPSFWNLPEQVKIEKSVQFLNFFKKLETWVKSNGRKNPQGDYVLPSAIEYLKDGGNLAQLHF